MNSCVWERLFVTIAGPCQTENKAWSPWLYRPAYGKRHLKQLMQTCFEQDQQCRLILKFTNSPLIIKHLQNPYCMGDKPTRHGAARHDTTWASRCSQQRPIGIGPDISICFISFDLWFYCFKYQISVLLIIKRKKNSIKITPEHVKRNHIVNNICH